MNRNSAFEEVYHAHKKQVFNLALHYVRTLEDAEEITQDVFVSIYHALPSFQQNSSLSTWIHRIAVNKCLDFLKSKKRKKQLAFLSSLFSFDQYTQQNPPVEPHHPGILLEDKEELMAVLQQVDQLPIKQRTAIILHKIMQKPLPEVAEIMNQSTKAVGQLVLRAKKNLNRSQ